MNPINYKIGDKVKLTAKSFENIVNSNKSTHAYPCDSFIERLQPYLGQTAVVIFKDNWVERA